MTRAGFHVLLAGPWLALFFCLHWSSSCPAATSQEPLRYAVRIWQTDDGLPQNSVWAITQTSDGYLWVGTHEGLARFDGAQFWPLEVPGAPELKHGWITALLPSRDGSLWICVDGVGVLRLKDGTLTRFTEADGLPGNQTRCLLESRDGSVWVGSESGLSRFHGGRWTHFTQREGLGDNSVRALWEDRQGLLRVATKRGLTTLTQSGTATNLNLSTEWIANALRCVCEDRNGNIWTGSADGLYSLSGTNRTMFNLGDGLPDRVVNTIHEDRSGQLWVGTYAGLARIIDSKVSQRPVEEVVFGDLVYTVFEDREANLWVGARDGLYRLIPARFTTYTTEQGLSGNNVMSVCADESGMVWLGIWGGGLNALHQGKFSAYTANTSLLRDSVLSVLPTSDGTIWAGMDTGGGLQQLKNGVRTAIQRPGGWGITPIRVLLRDRGGTLWLGTGNGLNAYKDGKFEFFGTGSGLPSDSVLALREDAAGDLWIGTEGGLSRRHAGRFNNYTTRDGLSHNAVMSIHEDKEHSLWLGTRAGGLNRMRGEKITPYTTTQGLFSDEVYELIEDDFGFFWLSCRRGIFRVAKEQFENLDRGAIKTLTCTAFGKADGLLSVQCNGVAKPAGWKSKDGRVWFPTIRGVVAIESRIKTNFKPPPLAIEQVIADKIPLKGRPGSPLAGLLAPAPSLNIPPGRGELEIHYTSLSLQAPEKNQFRYRLLNADSDWRAGDSERVAHYNNLGPGRYTFQLVGCNNDGVWNEAGLNLTLVLQPHYWQTWWFKAAVLASVVLGLGLAYRARVARLHELGRLRVEIAANLHDDVGARLTKVAMITEQAEQEAPVGDLVKPHIQAIAKTTREVIQAMDEIVWTINPRNDTLEHLANYIFQYAQEYFQNTGVRCRLDLPAQLPELAISTEVRHNLFMALKEALNNVLKHAAASEVSIRMSVTDRNMNITIEDNGRGFTVGDTPATGNGLRNMKERLEKLGGTFDVASRPGSGTTITMELVAK